MMKEAIIAKAFPCVQTKTNSNFAVNPVEMMKEAIIHFDLMNHIFQASAVFNMCQLIIV